MEKGKKIFLIVANTVMLIILLTIISIHWKNSSQDYLETFLHVAKILFINNTIYLLRRFKSPKIQIGSIFILLGWFWNFLDPLLGIQQFTYFGHIFFYDIISFIGLILFVLGLLDASKHIDMLFEKLKKLAFYDTLTDLPNRNVLKSSCPISPSGDCSNCNTWTCIGRKDVIKLENGSAVLYLDIDDFKQVNDHLGHHYGDILIKQIGERIKSIVTEKDLIVHYHGDEFIIILGSKHYDRGIEKIIINILRSISSIYYLDEKEAIVSCSIGIALYPKHGKNIDELIKNADIAMYKAKSEGKSQFYMYTEDLNTTFHAKYNMIGDLKTAIIKDEFVVYYQLKADICSNEITGLEALVRWNHPNYGLTTPNSFISLAEELGLIKDIDIIVLNKVCKQLEEWTINGKKLYNISVNISPVFFKTNAFIETIEQILKKYQFDQSYLSIELTENIALDQVEESRDKMLKLKALKIKVHLDDFGKGYSSFSYIKEYPLDYVKIDKEFVNSIKKDKTDQILVKSVLQMAKILDFKVVAEGVETEEQKTYLTSLGCHEYQGYLLSKPLPIEDIKL